MEEDFTIYSYSSNLWDRFEGKSNAFVTIKNYLEKYPIQNELVFLEEKEYIDKNYLIDYTYYYARSFEDIKRKVNRLHFFDYSKTELEKVLSDLPVIEKKNSIIQNLNNGYLGFINQKPTLRGSIGRTVLKRYPSIARNGEKRVLNVTKRNIIHLFGIPLSVESLPFQEQDRAVSACATVAIWSALQALEDKFNISVPLAPSEITNLAFDIGSVFLSPKFPNEGLNIYQIINVFFKLGYEVTTYNALECEPEFIENLLMAYLEYGFPVLARLRMLDKKNHLEYHAVVISGYRYNEADHKIMQLYVHDDQIGPYSSVEFKNQVSVWNNEWITKYNFKKVEIDMLIIPLYGKIRLSYTYLYNDFIIQLKNTFPNSSNIQLRSFLVDINSYKQDLSYNIIPLIPVKKEALKILYKQMPRFLWIVRAEEKISKPLFDFIFDATIDQSEKPIQVSFI